MDSIYHDPSNPAAYGGVALLSKAADASYKTTKNYLRNNKTYRKFFRNKTKFERARVLVSSIGQMFQADLFDLQKYARQNGGYRYILLLVDSFSRLVKAKPLKHKSAKLVAEALREILTELRENNLIGARALLATDLGTEFWNSEVDEVYEEYGIGHYALRAPKKCSIAEISGRWLLDRIYKHMSATGENKWVARLQDFVTAKNKRPNRSLGNLASAEVTYKNQAEVYKKLFKHSKRKPETPLRVGQIVQISSDKLPFHKSFHGYFSDKKYEVIRSINYNGIFRYTLKDVDDNMEIAGTYYKQELFPVE